MPLECERGSFRSGKAGRSGSSPKQAHSKVVPAHSDRSESVILNMNLKSLLLSSDEKTVRILRRVLSDLEITVEHCTGSDAAIRLITRQRFEAIIVDCADLEDAGNVLRATKAAPVNKRALSIVLVE